MRNLDVLLADDRVRAVKDCEHGATVVAVPGITDKIMQSVDRLGMGAAQIFLRHFRYRSNHSAVVRQLPSKLAEIGWRRVLAEASCASRCRILSVTPRASHKRITELAPGIVRESPHRRPKLTPGVLTLRRQAAASGTVRSLLR